jgi:hypothetical protein
MTMAESQLALSALASLCAGEREAIGLLRKLLRRVRPTLVTQKSTGWGQPVDTLPLTRPAPRANLQRP